MWRLEKQAAVDAETEVSSEVIGTTIYNELDPEYYSEPQFPTRELPPLPVANHTNGSTDNTTIEMTGGMTSNQSEMDSGSSSYLIPSVMAAPYSGLESSTREPPLSPVSYESLMKPVYVNTNFATSEMTNDQIYDEHSGDSGISMQRPSSTSSEVETAI